MEQEIFSHLTNFFKRYYNEGDFISQRRYKKDVYAIPYEGEEVKLHWANADQYYIKTSEYLKDYSFVLPNGKKVTFQLKEASTEQNNNKTQGDGERRFAIYEEEPIEVDGNTLYINFTYELHKKSVNQDDLTSQAFHIIKKNRPDDFGGLFEAYRNIEGKTKTRKENKKDVVCEVIYHHLNSFISRNTFDYFIHKDLGGFLRRELDFYIKNEILFIDDINTENPAFFTAQLSKIKAFKTVADKIITFLAQIEDFQKKLWLKKKFVIRTDYCITLDKIPAKYYEEIFSNAEQLKEWGNLFSIKCSLNNSQLKINEEAPISLDELTINHLPLTIKYAVLDTKHFSEAFKDKLIAEFYNLDEETNGLLFNSENFQALNLMQEKYYNKIQTVYIDPPYNTVHSKILYKNQFEHSSWLSLMNNNHDFTRNFFAEDFTFGLAIDDYEYVRLGMLLQNTFSGFDINDIIINHHPQGSGGRLSRTHEHFILVSSTDSPQYLIEGDETIYEERSFMRSGTAENNYRYGRWNSFYALLYDAKNNKVVGVETSPLLGEAYPLEDTSEGYKRIYPINSKNEERVWRSSYETGKKRVENEEIFITKAGAIKQKIIHENKAEVVFSNWSGPEYNAGTQGSNILRDMGIDFDYPKSIKTMERIIELQSFGIPNNFVLDYFAGSGSTIHAVINLNRNKNRCRKYIGVDVGDYFESVILNRTKKVVYTGNWRNGKPQDTKGISQLFKYQVLESYEDTLNNLVLAQKDLGELGFNEEAQEEYLLQYMLDEESRDHLFNVELFKNPFDYKLKVTENNELIPTKVDLVETFNYLIGLYVEHIQRTRDIKFVEGTTREGIKTLVIWRNLETTTNKETEEVFRRLFESERTSEFQQIYINGDHNLTNFRTGEDQFKVKMIEETFFNKMFNVNVL